MIPTSITLGPSGGTLTLKASDGSVDWFIGESSSLAGDVTVAPAAGTLAAGESIRVTLSVTSSPTVLTAAVHADGGGGGGGGGCRNGDGGSTEGTLTVNPGGITVTVVLDIPTSPSCSPSPCSSPSSSPPGDDAQADGPVGRLVD